MSMSKKAAFALWKTTIKMLNNEDTKMDLFQINLVSEKNTFFRHTEGTFYLLRLNN
jgi:hypothetical protein